MGTGSWWDVLSRSQMDGILEVLESCCDVDDPADYKRTVVESIATVFRVRDVTFFFGPTFADIFADPHITARGDTALSSLPHTRTMARGPVTCWYCSVSGSKPGASSRARAASACGASMAAGSRRMAGSGAPAPGRDRSPPRRVR